LKECAAWFLEQGIQRVIITLGAEGALLVTREKTERIPSYRVDAKDTTGAGDAFIGSFAVFLAEGLPETEAVAHACKYAAMSTTKVGTQKSFPSRADFEQRFRAADPT
jgi:ribokinase